ncbi:hypothetical protein CDAR_541361 [Caerostris darwini]|uniref:Uncharacterized protein n=1 Tax=Caerostris darwini TaxID=1538125 RepID=A0AAV4VYD3_9ARAC|nr:hypothetical protein CDAR_541361 [Caerostris darwini]
MEGVLTSCSGSHQMVKENNNTKKRSPGRKGSTYSHCFPVLHHNNAHSHFPTDCRLETYYEQPQFQEVLKVTNPREASGMNKSSPHHHHSRIIMRRKTASQKPGEYYEDCD